jgi:hypothetical protein
MRHLTTESSDWGWARSLASQSALSGGTQAMCCVPETPYVSSDSVRDGRIRQVARLDASRIQGILGRWSEVCVSGGKSAREGSLPVATHSRDYGGSLY